MIGDWTMIEREKVISGLECCTNPGFQPDCKACPYNDNPSDGMCLSLHFMLNDALALLRSDQAQLVEQRTRLETIADIAIDYDGYRTAEDLMSLIDEMRDIALRGVPEEVRADAE